jgi:flagellar motor switch protein FliM
MQSSEQTATAQRRSSDPLLDQSGFAVERMPMLGVVFDRLTANLVEGMRTLTRAPTTFSVERIAPAGLFETLAASEGSIGAVLSSPELECRSLAAFDQGFVFALVQILLGGEGGDAEEPPNRPFTKIEMNLARKASDLTARSLKGALAGLVEASFAVDRQELLVDTTLFGRRDMAVVSAEIRFRALGMSGKMTIAIPQAALQPIRQKLSREAPGESSLGDPQWTRRMQTEVSSAAITVKGILEELPMTLGDVAGYQVGQVLTLEGHGMGRVRLECGDQALFWCKLNQVDGRYTLEVEEPIVEEKGLLEDIIVFD